MGKSSMESSCKLVIVALQHSNEVGCECVYFKAMGYKKTVACRRWLDSRDHGIKRGM